MNLTEWARGQGIHVQTGYRWYREGVACCGVEGRSVDPGVPQSVTAAAPLVGVGLSARVSSHGQKADMGRQVARLLVWAARAGVVVVRVGSGMDGSRRKVRRLLADAAVSVVVVEHRDRLGRVNTEMVESALWAAGRRLVVLDEGEVTDGLVGDVVEVLTWFCARVYGRGSAGNRALKALGCARRDIGPRAVLTGGGG